MEFDKKEIENVQERNDKLLDVFPAPIDNTALLGIFFHIHFFVCISYLLSLSGNKINEHRQ